MEKYVIWENVDKEVQNIFTNDVELWGDISEDQSTSKKWTKNEGENSTIIPKIMSGNATRSTVISEAHPLT